MKSNYPKPDPRAIVLLEKHMKRSHGKLTFDWAGAQKELQNQYSSVKLQHKISE